MNHYYFSYNKAHRHFIDITLIVETKGESELKFQLPSWRPGRYELANFAKNIQKWAAFDEDDNALLYKKITKDCWVVKTKQNKRVKIKYNYYANELNAGSTYLDEKQLYVNPVNCCLYIVGRELESCSVKLDVPTNYKIACGLNKKDKTLFADNFDQLAECPFIASNTLKHDNYQINGITFHLWFQGYCNPPFKKIKKDFKAFTKKQIDAFGGFPEKEYHFLFQITPYKSYHGVEHTNSTVILLGDEEDVFEKRYEDLLGISSHELYHTWNIKSIRPKEMLPYDYTKENYSKLGYVAEGVTTYMGDLTLFQSKVFDWNTFIKTQNENLKRHFENEGRHNLSVAESSFDTWLDGYTLGIPNRKTSIYTEGALNMLMIDLQIIKYSKGKYSLHDVMQQLYNDFALKGKGYTEKNFLTICVTKGGLKIKEIFKKHIYGSEDYTESMKNSLNAIGLKLKAQENPSLCARYFGFIAAKENGKTIIKKVQPNSIADNHGIAVEDEVLSINNNPIKSKKINDLIKENTKSFKLKIKRKFDVVECNFLIKNNHFSIFKIEENKTATKKQLELRKKWLK